MLIEGTIKLSVNYFDKDHFTERRKLREELGIPLSAAEKGMDRDLHYHPGDVDYSGQYYDRHPIQSQHYDVHHTSYGELTSTYQPIYDRRPQPPHILKYQSQYLPHDDPYRSDFETQSFAAARDWNRYPPSDIPYQHEFTHPIAARALRHTAPAYRPEIPKSAWDLEPEPINFRDDWARLGPSSSSTLFKSMVILADVNSEANIGELCKEFSQYGTVTELRKLADADAGYVEVVIVHDESERELLVGLEQQPIRLPNGMYVRVDRVESELAERDGAFTL